MELEKWEKKLEDSNESIEVFHEYLEYEMDGGDPARVSNLFIQIEIITYRMIRQRVSHV